MGLDVSCTLLYGAVFKKEELLERGEPILRCLRGHRFPIAGDFLYCPTCGHRLDPHEPHVVRPEVRQVFVALGSAMGVDQHALTEGRINGVGVFNATCSGGAYGAPESYLVGVSVVTTPSHRSGEDSVCGVTDTDLAVYRGPILDVVRKLKDDERPLSLVITQCLS